MTDKPEKKAKRGAITRRDLLKSAASLPVIGLLGHLSWKEQKLERGKKERIFEALQIDETDRPRPLSSGRPKQLVRIGLIGFGVRGEQLSRALGFARPEWIAAAKEGAAQNRLDTRLQDWLNQQDLHVAITAVCEVFDQRREQAATAARSTLRPGAAAGAPPPPAPAICIDYHDLVNRSDVDAVIIAFRSSLRQGEMAPGQTIVSFRPGMDKLDAITSASEKFYAGRGLIYTWRDGRRVDTSYLHLREWLGCIRDGGTPSCSMEKAFATTITCHMATRSYREQRRVTWDREREMIV